MKTGFLILTLSLLLSTFGRLTTAYDPTLESGTIALCGATVGGRINPMSNGKFIVALPGWGNYSYPISTRNDSAQYYFD